MITGFFIQIASTLILFFIGILPVYALPTEWLAAVTLIWGYISAMSFLLPVSTLLQVLGVAMLFHITVFVFNLSLKIYHMIRG